jgi:ribosomal protein S18 acetylase RimI-like enzyme
MEIRPWQCGDELLAVAAERHLSVTSLAYRFLTGTGGRLPKDYLRHIAAGPGPTWDAQVAVGSGHLIGWAEFGRLPGRPEEADLAVIVADAWQRQGIATALVREMLPRCLAAGVRRLHADVSPTNRAARGLLRSLFSPGLSAAFVDGVVHYELSLLAARRETPTEAVLSAC